MSFVSTIVALSKQLYPTGRAFRVPINGWLEALHKGLALSEARAYEDALSILYNILPDTINFTIDDVRSWEKRLGMISNESVPIEDRKQAIARKMNFPDQKARQNYRFLQSQLQRAGFDVTVYENRFSDGMGGYITRDPLEITGGVGALPFEFDVEEFNEDDFGTEKYQNIAVNHIDESLDWEFVIGDNLRSTFFIGGPTLGAFADIPEDRKAEFRQLVIRIKPQQTVAFLFVNYI